MNTMKPETHFDDDTWLDVVRNIPNPASQEVERHLNSGCQICHAAQRLWSGVRDGLPEALAEGPSEKAVRAVLNAFEFQKKIPLLTRIANFAQLLFDSALEPVPFGVRGGNSPARHLLHEAAGTLIDLQIEQETAMPASITGQIHCAEVVNDEQPEVPVYLVQDGERVLAGTQSNTFGEFQMEARLQGSLSIYLEMPGEKLLAIQLPELGPSSNAWQV